MRVLLPDGAEASADTILELLKKYKTIAVVGLSSNPTGPSPLPDPVLGSRPTRSRRCLGRSRASRRGS